MVIVYVEMTVVVESSAPGLGSAFRTDHVVSESGLFWGAVEVRGSDVVGGGPWSVAGMLSSLGIR